MKKMKKYELAAAHQESEILADVFLILSLDEFDAELEDSDFRVYESNGVTRADFAAKIRVFNNSFEDEYAIVEIDRKGLDLTYIPDLFSFRDDYEISEFQTRDVDRVEKVQEVIYDKLLVEVKFYAE